MKPQWQRKRELSPEPEVVEVRNGLGQVVARFALKRRAYHAMPVRAPAAEPPPERSWVSTTCGSCHRDGPDDHWRGYCTLYFPFSLRRHFVKFFEVGRVVARRAAWALVGVALLAYVVVAAFAAYSFAINPW